MYNCSLNVVTKISPPSPHWTTCIGCPLKPHPISHQMVSAYYFLSCSKHTGTKSANLICADIRCLSCNAWTTDTSNNDIEKHGCHEVFLARTAVVVTAHKSMVFEISFRWGHRGGTWRWRIFCCLPPNKACLSVCVSEQQVVALFRPVGSL